MKTITYLVAVTLLFVGEFGFSQINEKNYAEVVTEVSAENKISIGGYVTSVGSLLDNVEVLVYQNNKIVEHFNSSNLGEFEFDITTNNYYTVEFKRNGFFSKRIIIDTFTESFEVSEKMNIEFSVDLIKEEDLNGIDADVLDFPICKYEFDEKNEGFNFVMDFVENRYDEIQDLFKQKKNLDKINKKRGVIFS